MTDLLQNSVKLDEGIKNVLTSRLSATVSSTDTSTNFGEIFANATKKQNELMNFANNKIETKTNSKNEAEIKTTEDTKINKKENKKQVKEEKEVENSTAKEKDTNKTNVEENTTEKTTQKTEETLLTLGEAHKEIQQATAETTLIQTQKNNDFQKIANLKDDLNLEEAIEGEIDVEVDNIDTENLTTGPKTETLKGKIEENQLKISAGEENTKSEKAPLLVNEKNINIDKNLGEINLPEAGEIDVQNMVESEILEELNLSIDDITISAKSATSPIIQDASEQLFKMSLEKTAPKISALTKEKAQGIQGIQSSQGSANANESNSANNNNLNFQNMDKKLQQGKDFLNKMSEKAKMANIQKNDILNQIGAKFEQLKDGVTSKITLTLRPENLGRVVIEMSHDKNGVTTNILAQSQDVKEILEKNIGALKEQLTSAGVQVDNISIKAPESNENANFFSQNDFKDEKGGQQGGFEGKQSNKNFARREEKTTQENFYNSKEETNTLQDDTYQGIKVGNNVYSI